MSKLYVPNVVDINNVSCVYLNNDDSLYLTYANGYSYEVRYNNLLSDYVLTPTSNLDVVCQPYELTHEVYYRKDITNVLITFFIIALVCFYFPFKIFSRLFGRWLKV